MANEGVICWFWKRLKIENKERDQYKEAICILNTELTAKLALLKKETRHRKEVEKMNTNLTTELAAFCKQMDKAKVDIVVAFRISYPFFDECNVFYGDGFDDCLKQVAVVYSDLDLSLVAIGDIVPSTPRGTDAVGDETDDSADTIEEDMKYPDAEVVIQPAPKGLVAPMILSTAEGPSTSDGPSTVDSSLSNAPLS